MADLTWRTGIAEVHQDDVIIRGHRLADLVGSVTYADMAFLLIRGSLPTEAERLTLEGILVSLADHGISPSTIIGRTLASCGVPVQAAMSGALLSIGDYHGGSGEEVARLLSDLADGDPAGLEDRCATFVADRRTSRIQVPGFGHPQHADGDPRALAILRLADVHGVSGRHCRALAALGSALAASSGREALRYPNITGAIAGVLTDLGFPWQSIRGIVLSARCLGMTAHVVEELEQGNKWRHAPEESVTYTGPRPEDVRNDEENL